MKPVRSILATMVVALMLPFSAGAEEPAEPVGPKLPPKVRSLLIQEMNAILGASHDILDALVRGEDDIVADKAKAIHDSFIMKQKMTDADRKALLEAVPKAFVERDRAFHELTSRLAKAGRDGDAERQRRLFGRMVEQCVACHTHYASDRFQGVQE